LVDEWVVVMMMVCLGRLVVSGRRKKGRRKKKGRKGKKGRGWTEEGKGWLVTKKDQRQTMEKQVKSGDAAKEAAQQEPGMKETNSRGDSSEKLVANKTSMQWGAWWMIASKSSRNSGVVSKTSRIRQG
jgi:hypothetical protein